MICKTAKLSYKYYLCAIIYCDNVQTKDLTPKIVQAKPTDESLLLRVGKVALIASATLASCGAYKVGKPIYAEMQKYGYVATGQYSINYKNGDCASGITDAKGDIIKIVFATNDRSDLNAFTPPEVIGPDDKDFKRVKNDLMDADRRALSKVSRK